MIKDVTERFPDPLGDDLEICEGYRDSFKDGEVVWDDDPKIVVAHGDEWLEYSLYGSYTHLSKSYRVWGSAQGKPSKPIKTVIITEIQED